MGPRKNLGFWVRSFSGMESRRGSRAATEECQGLTPQGQPFVYQLGTNQRAIFRKRESNGCEQQGACMISIIAHNPVLHDSLSFIHL